MTWQLHSWLDNWNHDSSIAVVIQQKQLIHKNNIHNLTKAVMPWPWRSWLSISNHDLTIAVMPRQYQSWHDHCSHDWTIAVMTGPIKSWLENFSLNNNQHISIKSYFLDLLQYTLLLSCLLLSLPCIIFRTWLVYINRPNFVTPYWLNC